jgi:alpha-beta hydrolase superfamily lysophospholipase
MKLFLINTLKILSAIYVLICLLLYFFQEKLIFHPQKLNKDFQFQFDEPFEEKNIEMTDGTTLNGILFKAKQSKGLIFYLHGNAGSIDTWGDVAKTYTDLNYDVFILDYRGYGKSEGSINGQKLFFEDIQTVYNEIKKSYPENKIIVLGYSIGSGSAAKTASTNNPKFLILQAPYYNFTDIVKQRVPFIPAFILKYKFETNNYLKDCKMPVVVFHGDQDEVIYYGSSLKLQKEFKNTDTLITLKGLGHNGMTFNTDYRAEIKKILTKN